MSKKKKRVVDIKLPRVASILGLSLVVLEILKRYHPTGDILLQGLILYTILMLILA